MKIATPILDWNKCKAIREFLLDRFPGRSIKIVMKDDGYVLKMSKEMIKLVKSELGYFLKCSKKKDI